MFGDDDKKSGNQQVGGGDRDLGTRFLEVLVGAGLFGASVLIIVADPIVGVLGIVGGGTMVVDGIFRTNNDDDGEELAPLENTLAPLENTLAPQKKANVESSVSPKKVDQTVKKDGKKDEEKDEKKTEEIKKKEGCAIEWTCSTTATYCADGFEVGKGPFAATTTKKDCIVVFFLNKDEFAPGGKKIILNADSYTIEARLKNTKDQAFTGDSLSRKICIEKKRVEIEWKPEIDILEFSKDTTIPKNICNATTNPANVQLVYEWVSEPDLSQESEKTTTKVTTSKPSKPKTCVIKVCPLDKANYIGSRKQEFKVKRKVETLTEEKKLELLETEDNCECYDKKKKIKRKIKASWVGYAPDDKKIFEFYSDSKLINGGMPEGQVQNVCSQTHKAGGHYTYLGCKMQMYHTSTGNPQKGKSVTAWTIRIGQTVRVVGIGCHVSGESATYNAYFPYKTGTKLLKNCTLDLDIEDEAEYPPDSTDNN